MEHFFTHGHRTLFRRAAICTLVLGMIFLAGMADYEPGDQQVDAVLRRADQRMYERKKQLKEMGAAIRE